MKNMVKSKSKGIGNPSKWRLTILPATRSLNRIINVPFGWSLRTSSASGLEIKPWINLRRHGFRKSKTNIMASPFQPQLAKRLLMSDFVENLSKPLKWCQNRHILPLSLFLLLSHLPEAIKVLLCDNVSLSKLRSIVWERGGERGERREERGERGERRERREERGEGERNGETWETLSILVEIFGHLPKYIHEIVHGERTFRHLRILTGRADVMHLN